MELLEGLSLPARWFGPRVRMKLGIAQIQTLRAKEALMGSYVGIDLHRRRSVIVVLNEDGERVSWSRIDNTPPNLAAEIVAAGGPDLTPTWRWRRAGAGIGRRTCSPSAGPGCMWPIRWGSPATRTGG